MSKIKETYNLYISYIHENPWYEKTLKTLIKLESLVKQELQSTLTEKDIFFKEVGEKTNIDELLQLAINRVHNIFQKKTSSIELIKALWIQHEIINDVIMKPWEWNIIVWKEDSRKVDKKDWYPKFISLYEVLVDKGIFADDITTVSWVLFKNQIRETSYIYLHSKNW